MNINANVAVNNNTFPVNTGLNARPKANAAITPKENTADTKTENRNIENTNALNKNASETKTAVRNTTNTNEANTNTANAGTANTGAANTGAVNTVTAITGAENNKIEAPAPRPENANPQERVQNNALQNNDTNPQVGENEPPGGNTFEGLYDNKIVQVEQNVQPATGNPEGVLNQNVQAEKPDRTAELKFSEEKQINNIEEQNARNALKGLNNVPGPIIAGNPNAAGQVGSRLDTSI